MEELKSLKAINKENSTHTDKIKRISQTLQQVSCESKNPIPQKSTDQLELRLKQIEEKFENFREFDEKRFEILNENLENARQNFFIEKKDQREIFEDFKSGFDFWETDTLQKVKNLVSTSISFESELVDNIVNNFLKTTNEELLNEENKLEENKENLSKGLNGELFKNRERFGEISEDQEEKEREIRDLFERESKFISEKIFEYRVSKKEVEETVFGLIKEFVEKTQEEIENEHRERLKQEDQILTLLDKATLKLNHLSQV